MVDTIEYDGRTQPGYDRARGPVVALNGPPGAANGLRFLAGSEDSAVRGLRLQNFRGYGTEIFAAGVLFEDNGEYINSWSSRFHIELRSYGQSHVVCHTPLLFLMRSRVFVLTLSDCLCCRDD